MINIEYNDAPFYNGERISKIKTLLIQDLSKQKRYIQIIKTSIINFNCGKKETSSKLCQMLERFSQLRNYFGINIFFFFIQVYNYLSQRQMLFLKRQMVQKIMLKGEEYILEFLTQKKL